MNLKLKESGLMLVCAIGVAFVGCTQHKLEVKKPIKQKTTVKEAVVDNRPLLKDKLKEFINKDSEEKLSIDSLNKHIYKNGEELTFKIDTRGKSGYLYVFTVDKNGEVVVLYPNSVAPTSEIQGAYIFPDDFVSRISSEKFSIKMTKDCQDCQKEESTIYTLLTKDALNTRGARVFTDTPSTQSDFIITKVDYLIQ